MVISFPFYKGFLFEIKPSTFKKVIFSFCLFFFTTISLFAQDNLGIKKALTEKYIGKSITVFQDSGGDLNIKQILKSDNLFKASNFAVPNLGISKNSNWLKFRITNNTNQEEFILNLSNPIIDEVAFYVVRKNVIEQIKSTNYAPIRNRKYKHQFYLFDLTLKPKETVTCYLKLKADEQILAPISIYTKPQILPIISNADILTGLYLGIMVAMLLYNLFIYFTVKDKDYLIYCHYIFWVALTQATLLGFSQRFLWTNNIWLAQNMLILCGIMSGVATILFAKSFLKTKQYSTNLNLCLNVTIGLYLIAFALLLFDLKQQAFQAVNLTAVIGSLLVIFVAWFIYRKHYAPAKYFLLSWSVFFISILVFVLKDYGVVPYNQITVHAVEIGSALEAILLSFALANKINVFKKEKEISQAEALSAAQENERIIREQNIILEEKVNERTHELIETNHELSDTLEDLKEAQMQLVESEKMASLGQLTAGIAHEINNPINFVTSNVSPLTRDVNLLLEAIENIENIGLSEKSKADKQQEIEDYKDDLDFDYLKTEINHLLNGIHEGATRTAEIVKGLRVFSRLDEDDLKKADINECLDSTLIIMNSTISGSKIKLVKDYGDIPSAECYPGKLNQVFLNIIANAIHAIAKVHGESGEGELKISTHSENENIYITIKDNGSGMDEVTKGKIFDPFFTTKEVGEGTGLGMSIAYNTIKKHNGDILINSSPGEGTEIVIQIPIVHRTNIV